MNKLTLFFICLIFPFLLHAQTQQGYVKTKGVLKADGSITAGHRLSDVTISIQGINPILSRTKGAFSFNIPGKTFYLNSVSKKGFVLADPEATRNPYSYTTTPMVIVVEDEQERQIAIAQATRQIRTNMRKQIRKREEEIEALKKSELEKSQLLNQLSDKEAKANQLIKMLVERYVSTDYDLVSKENRRINALIMSGELEKADSLIGSREDLERLEAKYHEKEKMAKATEEAAKLARKDADAEKKNLMERYYAKFAICASRLLNDSAFYYLARMADVDTLLVATQWEACRFATNMLSDYEQSVKYNIRAIQASDAAWGKDNPTTASLYENLGAIHFVLVEDFNYAFKCLNYAAGIYQKRGGENDEGLIGLYKTIGHMYLSKEDKENMQKAKICFENALGICLKSKGENSVQAAEIYSGLGELYRQSDQDVQAKTYFLKSLDIHKQLGTKDPRTMSVLYHELGWVTTNESEKLAYYQQALEYLHAQKELNDIYDAKIYSSIANVYAKTDSIQAMRYYQMAIDRCLKIVGRKNQEMAQTYNHMATFYNNRGDFTRALEYLQKVANIMHDIGGGRHSMEAKAYDDMGNIYMFTLQDGEHGAECKKKSIAVYETVYGPRDSRVAYAYYDTGTALYSADPQQALYFYEKCIDIWNDNPKENAVNIAFAGQFLGDIYHNLGNDEKAMYYQRFCTNEINFVIDNSNMDSNCADSKVLAYGNWNITQPCTYALQSEQQEQQGKQVPIVIKNGNTIKRYMLPAETPLKISQRIVKEEEKSQLISDYREWSVKVKSKTDNLAVDSIFIVYMWLQNGAGAKMGLNGIYAVMEFGNWDITQPLVKPRTIVNQYEGKPKDVVLLQNGQLNRFHFDNKLGCYTDVRYLSPKAKAEMTTRYKKWKTLQKNK